MEKVLCVCLGNISRSPMMQVVLQQHLGSQRQTGPVIARALGLARSTVGLILRRLA
jgi:protein-tyrosine-phosphatase